MGNRLATTNMGRKFGGCASFGVSWVPIEHNVSWAEAYLRTKWHLKLIHPAVWTQYMGRKLGGGLLCPLPFAEGELVPHLTRRSPSNTMWPRPRSTSVPSFTLIHPVVWPQYTNVTDRHRQTGQPSDSIGRTVLQTVAQKSLNSV